ncbi:hypothetical protein [Spirosoma flavum]|uniref:Uncharacterized protein n=1 Tax=Spirosoma flavum TaxID=2048557 RepID=A0ABW6AFM3_9BACT
MANFLSDWLMGRSWSSSSWIFDTSEGIEFDALVFAAGKGSFYIKDKNDPDGIVHEMFYVGGGLTTSKGPLPVIGGAFSTPDMYSAGVGPIATKPFKILTLDDFSSARTGLIISGAYGGIDFKDNTGKPNGRSAAIVLFGVPPFTVAAGRIIGDTYIAPGIGFTIMPVCFVLDP